MKRIFHPLFAALLVLSLAAPVKVLAAGNDAPGCSGTQCKACCEKSGNSRCEWSEEVVQNKLVRGRAGQLQWVLMPVRHVHRCNG